MTATTITLPAINTAKDRWGKWNSTSRVELANSRQLKIRTSKNERGVLVTYASVSVVRKEDGVRIETFEVFGDYMKTVYATQQKRVTGKTVEEQQRKALEDLPYIVDNVKAFYAAKGIDL